MKTMASVANLYFAVSLFVGVIFFLHKCLRAQCCCKCSSCTVLLSVVAAMSCNTCHSEIQLVKRSLTGTLKFELRAMNHFCISKHTHGLNSRGVYAFVIASNFTQIS